MASVKQLIEILARFKEGEPCSPRDWDNRIVPRTVRKILKEHELEKTYNPNEVINQDGALADRFFEAGLELAETIGVLCADTETILRFSKEELLTALRRAPSELTLGGGSDKFVMRSRKPEDPIKPIFATSLSIQIDEELYVELVSELVKYKGIDILQGPSIDTIFGFPAYSETPFETAAGILEARLREAALWEAGRPNMQQMGMSSSVTEFGFMTGYSLAFNERAPMMGIGLQPSEIKTNFSTFNKAITAATYGGYLRMGCPSMIGGFSGPPEGSTIANIASDILQFALFQTDIANCSMFDIRMNSVCCRTGLWSMSMSVQATSRNTHVMLDKIINQSAGPCTEDILYTNAAGLIATSVSGMDLTTGPRSAGGSLKNYLTPLEANFSSDAFKGAAGMSLSKALEIVEYCLTRYEDTVDYQPQGKSYYECYDRKTRQPIPEWKAIDYKVREDLISRGLPL